MLSVAASAQSGWESIGYSPDTHYEDFVSKSIPKSVEGYYKVTMRRQLVSGKKQERAKKMETYKDKRYVDYDKTLTVYVIDLNKRRCQLISITDYSTKGDELKGYKAKSNTESDWKEIRPGTEAYVAMTFLENHAQK